MNVGWLAWYLSQLSESLPPDRTMKVLPGKEFTFIPQGFCRRNSAGVKRMGWSGFQMPYPIILAYS